MREEKNKKNIFWWVVLSGRYSLGRRCPIGHPFKLEMEDFKNFHIPWWDSYCYIQSYLVILLPLWGQLGECLYPSTHYEYKTSLYKWIWMQVLNRKIAFLFHKNWALFRRKSHMTAKLYLVYILGIQANWENWKKYPKQPRIHRKYF